MSPSPGTLTLCPTPIGNLEDLTLRVLRVLREVDLIAAENTRHTQKLLHHYGIHKKMISYYDLGDARAKEEQLLERLKRGESIALVSSAGTPLVSDPGYQLIKKSIHENIPVVSLPGPSALLTGLVASGLPPHPFFFGGFLPPKTNARQAALRECSAFSCTLIFYEAPHRLLAGLKDCLQVLGDRPASLARELTKIHEEWIRGTLSDLLAAASRKAPRGEFTLIIGGAPKEKTAPLYLEGEIQALLEEGLTISEASRQLANRYDISKNKIYALAHRLFRRPGSP